jgi:DNA-binding response OmpR family regulator/Tfp pilus assembly protein PilZ
MRTSRTVLLIGIPHRETTESLVHAAREAGLELELAATAEDATTWLDVSSPRAIVLEMALPSARSVCLAIRSNPRLANLPIIGLAPHVSDLVFAEMYAWGGDDVVPLAPARGIFARLRALPSDISSYAPTFKGAAVVAAEDRARRALLARLLRNAGYDVRFAIDSKETLEAASGHDVTLVVADSDVSDGGAVAMAREARSKGGSAPWVIVTEPKRLAAARKDARGLARVAIADAFAPQENVIFVANELTRAGGTIDARASARLLYGTTVGFRAAGRDEDTIGCTYNLSAGGIYVRTLAPLPRGEEIWLELRPPRSDRRVRLEGKVAWHRAYGPNDTATVPPGFGVQITDGSTADRLRYRDGYAALAADLLGADAS